MEGITSLTLPTDDSPITKKWCAAIVKNQQATDILTMCRSLRNSQTCATRNNETNNLAALIGGSSFHMQGARVLHSCCGCLAGSDSQSRRERRKGLKPKLENKITWVWLKIQQEGLRRFWSMFPLSRVPCWYRFFEPLPHSWKTQLCRQKVIQSEQPLAKCTKAKLENKITYPKPPTFLGFSFGCHRERRLL